MTNLESQLKQQNAADRLDQVLAGNPRVRETWLYPAGDPTSQIVTPRAVLNVLTGERYKNYYKENGQSAF
ncbi:hypothetical protein KCP73_03585 [Salmonella enterica subsp. enterica]|nr:hypothetical protein KCP73_03585 [Salmonella enterica subsp. enterica]